MLRAVISGDIISSTSLDEEDKIILENHLKKLLDELNNKFDVYGRVIKGDFLECVIPESQNAMRVALAIKSYVKTIPIKNKYKGDRRVKLFRTHGIRLAIGYGELSRFDREKGIIDGEAIYLSGRLINKSSTHNKERIVIKNTLYFISNNQDLNENFEPLMALIDVLISKATSKQSMVLYMKLLYNNEEDIAESMNIVQSVVNQHSTSVGWNAIEKAVDYFSEIILNN